MVQIVNDLIEEYALKKSTLPSTAANELATYTRQHEAMAQMLVGEMVGSFLGLLIRITGSRRILEMGTFSGHSALMMAEHLPAEGEIHTIDIEPKEYTHQFWQKSPHGHKITSHRGTILEVVNQLDGLFDMVFIDADKENYQNYLELALPRLTPRGFIVVDNVLWSGAVLKSEGELGEEETSAKALKKFNDWVASRRELYATLLPIRDGLFLISRKDNSTH